MALVIRPATAGDYVRLAEVADAAWPGVPHSAEEIQEEDEECKPPARSARFVAELDGQVVGNGGYFQSPTRYHPQKFWLDLFVHPEVQGQGIGEALYRNLLEVLAPFDPVQVRTFTREDIPRSQRFFADRGYEERKRTWESILDVAAFDFSPYAGVADPAGIRIVTLPELMELPDWAARYQALAYRIQEDVPDFDPPAPLTEEQFRHGYVDGPHMLPEASFYALSGDELVGLSTQHKASAAERLNTGLTGVLREFRGRGIAMALKLRGIAYAREHGYRQIRTSNASTNRPMLAINERLGFVKEPAWLHLVWQQ